MELFSPKTTGREVKMGQQTLIQGEWNTAATEIQAVGLAFSLEHITIEWQHLVRCLVSCLNILLFQVS